MGRFQLWILLLSILLIALCAIVYELVLATLSSYLLGDSVHQFSITIGLFLSAMGLGSYLSRFVKKDLLDRFIEIEIAIGVVGGVSSVLLFAAFALVQTYVPVMLVSVALIGCLVGLELPILTRIIKARASLRIALSQALAWDYLGSLAGCLLFPMLLLPHLGLNMTAAVVGMCNVTVAGINLLIFRRTVVRWRRLVILTLSGITGLLIVSVLSGGITKLMEQRLYQDEVLLVRQSPYQRLVLTRWQDDMRLYINGNIQFSSVDEYRYHESMVHPAMAASPHRERVLVLGGGDGLALREVFKYQEVKAVTLVDLDPVMTDLGSQFLPLTRLNRGSMADGRVKVVNMDAFRFLEETGEIFDVILADLPDPNNESLAKLYSVEFYRLVRRHLGATGIFVTQASSPFFSRQAFWCIVRSIAEVFCPDASGCSHRVEPYHVFIPSFGDWGFVMAAMHRLPEPLPPPVVPVRFLDAPTLISLFSFPPDSRQKGERASHLVDPAVMYYYLEDWNEWN